MTIPPGGRLWFLGVGQTEWPNPIWEWKGKNSNTFVEKSERLHPNQVIKFAMFQGEVHVITDILTPNPYDGADHETSVYWFATMAVILSTDLIT